MIRRAAALVGTVAVLALSGCASDDWQGRYDDAQREIVDLASERDTARQQSADLMADLEAMRAQKDQLDRENRTLSQREQDALRRALDAETARDAASVAPVAVAPSPNGADKIVIDLGGQGYDAFVTKDGNVGIRLASDVTFGSGKHALTSAGMATLRKLGPSITAGEFSQYDVRVEGHTDNEPLKKTKKIYGDNRGLGSARANSVTQFLEGEFGISPSRIEAVSKGEHEPIADNGSKAGRAKNRRVEIILVLPRENIDRPSAR